MSMESIKEPEWVGGYCVKKEALSETVRKWTFIHKKEHGYMYICKPFEGVHLWANDVYMHCLPTERVRNYHFIKFNYCKEGRCEVLLEDEKYVYLEDGILSIDLNSPKNDFIYPSRRYMGLEIVLDLEELKRCPVQAFSDCGIDIWRMQEVLNRTNGTYVGTASVKWKELAEYVMDSLINARDSIEDYRFYTLQMLFLLGKGNTKSVEKQSYLTKGQRRIVMAVEETVRKDLKRRYTAGELAKEYGISPSSLKKYFEQFFGIPLSVYVREKRMEAAKELLVETRKSIADIAAESGYGNQGKFGSAFKKFTGVTPLEYRRLHRNEKWR